MSASEGARAPGPLRSGLSTVVVAAALGALLARFALGGGGATFSVPAATRPADAAQAAGRLEAQLRLTPDRPQLLTELGLTYITRARDTADPTFLSKAATVLERSRALDGQQAQTLTGLGLLALVRHDFRAALDLGTRAHALNPASAEPLGVLVDALVELGRYDDASARAQEMVDRRPSLASLSRASYLRELHGDLDGAIMAMTQARLAGAGSRSDVAYIETLLGDLYLGRGDRALAEAAYHRAVGAVAQFPAAEVGLARLAASAGEFDSAAVRLAAVTERLPQPGWIALLGDVFAAGGRMADAVAQYDLVRTIERLNEANGVNVDLELTRFEADHLADPGGDGEAVVAKALATRAVRPTIYASDTVGWALRQAGRAPEALPYARDAVRLGTADGVLWYHLAAIEADLGLLDQARAHLHHAFFVSPSLTVRDLPAARALAHDLGISVLPREAP